MCATTQQSAPPTPTGLTAAGGKCRPKSPGLERIDRACKYNIYRDGAIGLSVAAPALTALDTGLNLQPPELKPQTNYCYTISAESCSGNESEQSTRSAPRRRGADPVAGRPDGDGIGGSAVRLNWNAAAGATGYRIYRNGIATLLAERRPSRIRRLIPAPGTVMPLPLWTARGANR